MPGSTKTISSSEFKRLVNKYLRPKLRECGWTGTGFHYKKMMSNHYIFLLGLYPGKYGGEISVEVGMHLDFLKNHSDEYFDLEKIKSYSADIRQWLLFNSQNDYTLKFQSSPEKNIALVDLIWESYLENGKLFFNQFIDFPGPFRTINVSDLIYPDLNQNINFRFIGTTVRFAWYLAQINEFVGHKETAKQFALYALSEITGPAGSSLIPQLTRISQL